MEDVSRLIAREWDYIVVGTGIGGATVGHALAKAGRSVLFLEKGTSPRKESLIRGVAPEERVARLGPLTNEHRELLRRSGRYFQQYVDATNGRRTRFFPFLGSGVGGSSAIYGALLERFQPLDFTPGVAHREAFDSTVPREWPITYEAFLPYYERAEALYEVRPAPLTETGRELHAKLASYGLHPYAVPTACRFVEGCRNCQGILCDRNCKVDSYTACLAPALDQQGAALIEDCEVLRLTMDGHRVRELGCRLNGRELRLPAKMVILGAGAMETPRLLLNSADAQWPQGVANGSGRVGRNLMRHLIDFYVVAQPHSPANWGKEVGFNDLYVTSSGKFGVVAGLGPMPPAPVAIADMERNPVMRAAAAVVRPFLRMMLKRFSSRFVFASFLEDLPFADNRVNPGPDTTFEYRIHPYDARRLKEFRSQIRRVLRPLRPMLLRQAELNDRLVHACGTCRFGTDPSTSVLDKNNRAHEVENLYVVDSSFFPSSGGTAPSLTIAANALRVANHLVGA